MGLRWFKHSRLEGVLCLNLSTITVRLSEMSDGGYMLTCPGFNGRHRISKEDPIPEAMNTLRRVFLEALSDLAPLQCLLESDVDWWRSGNTSQLYFTRGADVVAEKTPHGFQVTGFPGKTFPGNHFSTLEQLRQSLAEGVSQRRRDVMSMLESVESCLSAGCFSVLDSGPAEIEEAFEVRKQISSAPTKEKSGREVTIDDPPTFLWED